MTSEREEKVRVKLLIIIITKKTIVFGKAMNTKSLKKKTVNHFLILLICTTNRNYNSMMI